MISPGDKRKRIYDLLEMIERNDSKKERFLEWARPKLWYLDAGIPFSDNQVQEIHDFLEKLRKEP